jgi:hypothetical protein
MISRKISAAVALTVLLALGVAGPAQAEESPPAAPELDVSLEQLQEYGIVGDPGAPVDTQVDEYGNTFYAYADGQYVIIPEANASARAGFNVTGCAGTFVDIVKLSGAVYWGAQNSCATSTPNGVYPHRISAALRSTCAGIGCIIYNDVRTATTPASQAYNLVATLSVFTPCVTNTLRHYNQIIQVQVKTYQAGPFVSPTAYNVPCNVNPD